MNMVHQLAEEEMVEAKIEEKKLIKEKQIEAELQKALDPNITADEKIGASCCVQKHAKGLLENL